jgi:2-haloacid dehalogenase
MSLLTEMAKRARLPWDCILSAELFRCYKPDAKTYLGACTLLGTRPDETLMVAAHEEDFAAARANGLRTAFVRRPREFGRRTGCDLPRDTGFDLVADDFVHLAEQLGA